MLWAAWEPRGKRRCGGVSAPPSAALTSPAEPQSGRDTCLPSPAAGHPGENHSRLPLEVSRLNSGSKSDRGPQTLLTPTCPWSSLGWGLSSAKPGSAHLCSTHLSLLYLIHPTLSSLTPLARLRASASYTRSLAIRLHEG